MLSRSSTVGPTGIAAHEPLDPESRLGEGPELVFLHSDFP